MFIYYESLYKELVKSRSRKLKWLARATLLWWARAFSACHFPVLYVHLSHSFFGFTQLLGGGRYFSILFISSTLNFLLFLLKNVLLFSKNKPILFKMLMADTGVKKPIRLPSRNISVSEDSEFWWRGSQALPGHGRNGDVCFSVEGLPAPSLNEAIMSP